MDEYTYNLIGINRGGQPSARLILGVKKHEHITPGLISLHWLPVQYRIIFKVLLLTYKCMHGKGPGYLNDLLEQYIPTRTLRSSTDNLLCVPKTRYVEAERRAFSVRAPREWNDLPRNIKNCESVCSFRSNLKTYLFRVAYNLSGSCDIS